MNRHAIYFDLESGGRVAVESTNPVLAQKPQGQLAEIGIADKTIDTLKDAIAPLRDVAVAVRDALISACPDATEVEFGVKIEGKGNIIITAGTVEANLKVTMKWKRNRAPDQG
jgi:hypothetical protein